jgi:diguanylate cyclase (GGDEF)-like protein
MTIASARFLADLLPPATTQPDLLAVITSKGVQLALDHGLTGASAYAFALHAVVLAIRLGDDEGALRCLHIAQRILHELPAPEFRAKVNSAVVLAMAFWEKDPQHTLELLHEGYAAGMAAGDVNWAVYNLGFWTAHQLMLGGPLDEIENAVNTSWRLLERYASIQGNVYMRAVDDAVRHLTGRPLLAPPPSPVELSIDETIMRGQLPGYATNNCLVERLTAAYIFGEYADALRFAETEESVSFATRGTPVATERYFYHALTLTALYPTAAPEQQQEWATKLEEMEAALDDSAARSPVMFGAKAMLVSAERARVTGRVEQARGRYDQAIGLAHEHQSAHVEALAAELAGRHANELEQPITAAGYLDRARACYAAWGAAAKVEQLDRMRTPTGSAAETSTSTVTVAALPQQLDMVAVLKASQAISGELDLDKLLATLLELVVQHAGAERGCLVVTSGSVLRIAASAEAASHGVIITADPTGPLDQQLPLALVRYTLRSRQLVVGGPDELPPLVADAYLDQWQPSSMLCAPLSRHGETVAVIYLEHRRLTGAFTADHLSVFEVLCAQAVISLENAGLYGDLAEANGVLDAAFDQLPSGLLLLRPDLTVRRASTRFQQILGMPVPPGTALQEVFDAITPMEPDGRRLAMDAAAAATALLTGTVAHREIALPALGDRAQLLLDAWAIPLVDDDGEPVAIAVLISDITDRRRVEDELRHRALHDGLTGLPNRALFMDRLELALARLNRNERMAAVLFLDVDDFKLVNDTLGHSAGDQVLAEFARRVTGAIRPQDTAARFGGDEFAVLCEDLGDEAEAISVATRLRAAISQPLTIEHVVRTTTVSVGIAITHADGQSAPELLRDADTAMFKAKERGGNRHAIFDEQLRHGLLRRLEIEPALRRAVAEGQLVAHFQPKLSLDTGTVNGAEALVRWNRPGHPLVQPRDFISAAEDIGIVAEIDLWMFTQACRLIAGWRDAGTVEGVFTIATNLSAVTFNQDDLPSRLHDILAATGADPQDLCLEITETVLMAEDSTAGLIHPLKDLGVQLAIDDFGTGYSSLAYLRRFPVDVLKIDRSFVTGLATNSQDTAIARAVIALAHSLDLRSVAEGVETAEQLAALRALKCDEGQGFYFSPPVPGDMLEPLLGQRWPAPAIEN